VKSTTGRESRGTTIRDVARLARTSKSTASRYLNGQRVKEHTAEAIRQAVLQLNYHRNENARRLALNRTGVIGVVLDDISNGFYSGILQGVGEVSRSRGYGCVFYNVIPDRETEGSFLELVHEGRVDGLILLSFRKRDREEASSTFPAGAPIVLFGDDGGAEVYSVDVDNFGGSVDVVRHLHRLGHSKITHIAGPEAAAASPLRTAGYKAAMKEFGLPLERGWIADSDWTVEGGYRAMKRLLQRGGFTAVFASNDGSAAGALRAIREAGPKVPEDLSVVGFDDNEFAPLLSPALTTVRQPWTKIGARLAGAVLDLTEGVEPRAPRRELMEPELLVRDSCGRVSGGR
jgi:DNA-binding LacI/PurR family transcriptional regulator